MNIATSTDTAAMGAVAATVARMKVDVGIWRQMRRGELETLAYTPTEVGCLRDRLGRDAAFLIRIEFPRPLPYRRKASRRTPFYRWTPNPVRNPEPVAVQ